MSRRRLLSRCLAFVAVATTTALLWQATSAEKSPENKVQPADTTSVTQTLGGESRYLTFVSTDKPMYRPGEKVYLRAVVLHHATRQPLPENQPAQATVEIKGPKGDTVASGWVTSEDSVFGFSWEVPPSQAGGEYVAKVTYPWLGYAPAQRKFDIRVYRAPRLKSQIKFLRDGYGPSDDVAARLHVERAEGGVPAGAKVTVIARVDGGEVLNGVSEVDAQGDCVARFQLPPDIRRGEGTLAMVIEDGGVVETATKTIPILLQTVDLTMYPEGGELVAGLPNRVYFEAFTPAKKPADLAGVVLDAEGQQVSEFRSQHEGRGRFDFTPEKGGRYALKITEPAGIKTLFPLPDVSAEGVVLHADKEVYAASEPVTLHVAGNPSNDGITVTIAQREVQLAAAAPEPQDGDSSLALVRFDLPETSDGVLTATVWDAAGKPLAERLIFRQPAKSIAVKITADAGRYTPGGTAKLTIETTDATGEPVSAVVGVTVTDDSVLEMIEKREQAPRLPVMVFLENEVKDLADAQVYLDSSDPKAPAAVDLLLGTQGWRRFAFVDPMSFIGENGDAGRRVAALRLSTEREVMKEAQMGGGVNRVFERRGGVPLPAAPPQGAPRVAAAPVQHAVPDDKPAEAAPQANRELEQPALQVAGEAKALAENPVPAANKPMAGASARPFRDLEENGVRKQLADELDRQGLEAEEQVIGGRLDAAKRMSRPARNDFVAVRVFAHEVRAGRKPGERTDFAETLFWHAGIKTDEKGIATVEFGLNDAVTSFRVFADAFGSDGALGSGTTQVESVEPFYLEPKLPLEVTAGDKIQLPIGVVNATNATLEKARFTASADTALGVSAPPAPFDLAGDTRVRRLIDIDVRSHNGPAEFTLRAAAGPYNDRVTRTLIVRPQGFPIQVARGGLIAPGDTVSHDVTIPDNLVPGSLTGRIVVYPTPLASMTDALEGLIREPYGCFEQTSSTVYPLVMAQQYFMSHQGVDPSLVERSSQILTTGYERLLGFECKSGGFEWFGSDPGHDALTAYGLLEFTDMARVHNVDPVMLERTRKWLLEQRDGKGGFARKTHTLHTWLPEPEVASTYDTWALLEAGVKDDLATEVAWIRDAAERTDNTYVMALAANVLALAGDKEGENHLLDKLAGKQSDDGSLSGATMSVVGSGGEALTIEATSLAVMAWLKNPSYAPNVEKSIQYLAESCKAGRFGSTQSTVLALRAIVAYDQSRAKPKAPGSLQLVVDGKPVGEPVAFGTDTQGAIELPKFAELLKPGQHQLQVVMHDGSQMPYSLAVEYNSLKPASADECKVHMQVRLRDTEIEEGGVTEVEVVVINRTNDEVPTPLAIIGIPGGLEVRHDQLKELVKSERIAAYEVLGREVVLYWRVLPSETRVELPLSLVASIPGRYTGPASRAYLYYTDEHKQWTDPLTVTITPKSGE